MILPRRNRRHVPKGFLPPSYSSLLQWIDTCKSPWYDAGDTGYLRSDDMSGNGNYALRKKVPILIPITEYYDRSVFTNDGIDWIDVGRPSFLSYLKPSIDSFTICVKFILSQLQTYQIIHLGGSSSSSYQISIASVFDGRLIVVIGGNQISVLNTIASNTFYYLVVSTNGSIFDVWLNGTLLDSSAVGSYVATESLLLTAKETSSVSNNLQGSAWDFDFFYGYTTNGMCDELVPMELFKADEGSGNKIYGSILRTEGLITAGEPETEWDYGIVNKIILNNDTGIDYTDYTAYPAPSTELTRAEIEALHDPFVFSTCTKDLDHFRILLYESVPDVNPSQGIKILNYVGRYGYVAAVDRNGDYVIDSNGHYAIALP